MNVNSVSGVNYVNTGVNVNQAKATNPFLMKSDVDTFEFSTPKQTEPKTKLDVMKEKLNEGFTNAGETFKAHVVAGFDKAAQDAESITDPTQAMSAPHVAANTAFIGQAVVGTGAAIVEIAKGIMQAFKALA